MPKKKTRTLTQTGGVEDERHVNETKEDEEEENDTVFTDNVTENAKRRGEEREEFQADMMNEIMGDFNKQPLAAVQYVEMKEEKLGCFQFCWKETGKG